MKKDYYKVFIDFLKKHKLYNEEALKYLYANGIFFDFSEEEYHYFIGCYYIFKNNKLQKTQIIAPYIKNEETLLINIHEFTHGLLLYRHLNKKVTIGKDSEVLPMLYERVYLKENHTETAKIFIDKLNNNITPASKIDYIIALNIQEQMLTHQAKEDNPIKLEKTAKKLVKKYKPK